VTGVLPNIFQPIHTVQVYQYERHSKTETHGRDETLTTGQELGIIAMLLQKRNGFCQGTGCIIIKFAWNHNNLLLPLK
jgi:hypothetical protein